MNPLTNVKNITKLNEIELSTGLTNKSSWHNLYKDSAWIFIGGLAYGMTEGDIIVVFSQYGEIVNINMVRDKKTGKTKGYCFLCYANQKSTILAVDNLNGIKLCQRTIRVDHVENYKPPKEHENDDDITKALQAEGCAPKRVNVSSEDEVQIIPVKPKKVKKEKKKKKKKHKKHSRSDSSVESDEEPRHSSRNPKTSDSSHAHHSQDQPEWTQSNHQSNFKSSQKVTKEYSAAKHSDDYTSRGHHSKHKSVKKRHHSDSDSSLSSPKGSKRKREDNHKEHDKKRTDKDQHSRSHASQREHNRNSGKEYSR